MNLNEGIDNHLTVMVPGTQPLRFLCIAYGLAWSEVTASNLLLLDETGKVLEAVWRPGPDGLLHPFEDTQATPPCYACLTHTYASCDCFMLSRGHGAEDDQPELFEIL